MLKGSGIKKHCLLPGRADAALNPQWSDAEGCSRSRLSSCWQGAERPGPGRGHLGEMLGLSLSFAGGAGLLGFLFLHSFLFSFLWPREAASDQTRYAGGEFFCWPDLFCQRCPVPQTVTEGQGCFVSAGFPTQGGELAGVLCLIRKTKQDSIAAKSCSACQRTGLLSGECRWIRVHCFRQCMVKATSRSPGCTWL